MLAVLRESSGLKLPLLPLPYRPGEGADKTPVFECFQTGLLQAKALEEVKGDKTASVYLLKTQGHAGSQQLFLGPV